MTTFSSHPLNALTRESAEALAAKLVAEMIERWRQGERLRAEDFLTRYPELWEHPAAAADLIYEEFCLRQEHGPEVPVEQVLLRFPQWRPQLEVLFDCQRILGPRSSPPQFPAAGEFLGDFLILTALGSGAQSRVFLASQLSLGARPVVLKLTPYGSLTAGETHEHLSLARLQHTHIVPLYSVQDYLSRGLRALCMPYFGGATLAQLLEALVPEPPAQRTGHSLLDALDRVEAGLLADCRPQLAEGEANLQAASCNLQSRRALAVASYVQAVCWIGAALADALQYAHERGLVHLDLKPSNVLLAADAQPMLLDFHLAREPIHPKGKEATWLGGTAGYMSPEQQAALLAIQRGRSVERPVDGRSDIYSLGVVLYEALAGSLPATGSRAQPLHLSNSRVSIGLADVVSKCLADDPDERYPHMAALATDLRRQLAHLPLAGVRNRSMAERWRKWRRRRPHGVALLAMMLAVLTAAGAVAIGAAGYFSPRIQEARTALSKGDREMERKEWEGAINTLQRGLYVARGVPFQGSLIADLDRRLHLAEQEWAAVNWATAARELHKFMNRVRFLYAEQFPAGGLRGLEASCRRLWEKRAQLMWHLSSAGAAPDISLVRDDLLDLAIFLADLQVRLASVDKKDEARQKALAVLDEAEELFGPNPVLEEERRVHGTPTAAVSPVTVKGAPASTPVSAPSAAWTHYALGRFFLRSENLADAAKELEQAVRLEPEGLWPNFYLGLCAYRQGRYADAVAAYSVCIGAAPEFAGCFHKRALAFEAMHRTEEAILNYDQALQRDGSLAAAFLNRGMLHYREKRYDAALSDLERARELGADPAVVSFDLALTNLSRGEQAAALDNLRRSLSYNPNQAEARKLYDRLQGRRSEGTK